MGIVVAEAVPTPGFPGPAAILPFGLRGQAVFFPFLLAQPFAKIHRIVPRNEDHRMLVRLIEARISPAAITHLVALLVNELSKLPDRDLRGSHVKWLRDLHGMLRPLGRQVFLSQVTVPNCLRQRSISSFDDPIVNLPAGMSLNFIPSVLVIVGGSASGFVSPAAP